MSAPLILASTSPYRRELLSRLRIPFETVRPLVDETPLPGESAAETAERLAYAKAADVAARFPSACVIGSDQVALLHEQQLGKPGNYARAFLQLQAMRNQTMVFHTALCVIDGPSGQVQRAVVPYEVKLRNYTDAQIDRYLRAETPYDCAGSAKTEGLGVIMLEWMRGDDPTALIGLPLIALVGMLANTGMCLPADDAA